MEPILRDKLVGQLEELHQLASLQRMLRLGLRALWLAIGGYLLTWGVNTLWGWLPDRRLWALTALAFAAWPLVELALSLSVRSRWVWRLDRRLGLQEQVSTAWEVVRRGEVGLISEALIDDVLKILPRLKQRMLQRGWFLEREIVSFVIVVGLVILVALSSLAAQVPDVTVDAEAALPLPPTREPRAEEVFPQGPLGLGQPQAGPEDGESQGSGEIPGEGQSGEEPEASESPGGSATDPQALADALQEMGRDLSGQAGTHDLGQALENLELGQAAEDLEDLSDQLDDLSPETREKLAEAMNEAGQSARGAGDEPLAQDLQDAAGALQEGQNEDQAGDEMGQVAEDLRQLAQEGMGSSDRAGSGTGENGSGGTGAPEPADRLAGQGEDLSLEVEDPSQSGLLSPAAPQAGGPGTASGSLDSGAGGGEDVIDSPIVPNHYLWKWRDVVSEYFRR